MTVLVHRPRGGGLFRWVALWMGFVVALGGVPVFPDRAAADPQSARHRPAVMGMVLTEPHVVGPGVGMIPGKARNIAAWAAPTAVEPGRSASTGSLADPSGRRGWARVGSLPVRVADASQAPVVLRTKASSKVSRVEAVSYGKRAHGSWVVGVRADATGPIAVEFDARVLGLAAERAQVVRLPGCAVTSPSERACQTASLVKSVLGGSGDDRRVVAVVEATEEMSVFALVAGAAGASGNFGALPGGGTSAWSVGGSSGDFTWSYPMSVVPVAAGLTPSLALGYSAQSVDGRTVATNNQTSWVGEGWDMSFGFIERDYVQCADDLVASNTTIRTGDMCWDGANARVSMAGHVGELIQDSTSPNIWRLRNDDGTRFELLVGANNGDNDGEHWKATTPDGNKYFFGKGRVGSEQAATNSVWTVPVFGNQPGEPCHATTFAASACDQGWRWNLDYMVDAHGNAMAARYATELNRYGQNLDQSSAAYVRAGYLSQIDYGLREGGSANGPARLVFSMAERCIPTGGESCTQLTTANKGAWPDVPFDQICTSTSSCAFNYAPSFFTTKRLVKISTQMRTSGGFEEVTRVSLQHQFLTTGDGTTPALWLAGVTRSGKDGTPVFGTVSFTGIEMPNRVDQVETSGVAAGPFLKYRITAITTETGGQLFIHYSSTECTPATVPAPESNTKRSRMARVRP